MRKIISCILLILIISINKPLKALPTITKQHDLTFAQINLTPPEINEVIIGIITTYMSGLAIKYSSDVISYTINKYIEAIKAFCNATAIPINKILSPFIKMASHNQAIKIKVNQKINPEQNIELNQDIEINPTKINVIKKTFFGYLNDAFKKSFQALFTTFIIILAINEITFLLDSTGESILKLVMASISSDLSYNASLSEKIKKCGIDLFSFFALSIKKTKNIILKPFITICGIKQNTNTEYSLKNFLIGLFKYIKTKYSKNQNKNIYLYSNENVTNLNNLELKLFMYHLQSINKTIKIETFNNF